MTIGNRTRDLPACGDVLNQIQRRAPQRSLDISRNCGSACLLSILGHKFLNSLSGIHNKGRKGGVKTQRLRSAFSFAKHQNVDILLLLGPYECMYHLLCRFLLLANQCNLFSLALPS